MDFPEFADKVKANFEKMTANATHLFEVDADRDEIYEVYLDSYPVGSNNIFRERREHDCSACKSFIRNIGKAVVIDEGQILTIWNFKVDDPVYQQVLDTMDAYVKSKPIVDLYHSNVAQVGVVKNFEKTESGVLTWHHLNVTLPNKFVTPKAEGMFKSEHRGNFDALRNSLSRITVDSINTVLELIYSNTLYKGEEWKAQLEQFLLYKLAYEDLQTDFDGVMTWIWFTSAKVGPVISRMRTHSIGVLLQNLSEGMDLEVAVKKYEAIVAPENYKRPKPIYTQRMLEDAQKKVEELGLIESLPRRFAEVTDITIRDLKFANRDVSKKLGADVFGELAAEIADDPRKYSKVEEIGIEKFLVDVLPHASELELMIENKHLSNFVSLIAPINTHSPVLFKWGNNFSWAYAGNLTDSSMRDNVKAAGGRIVGDVLFRLQWNEKPDIVDLDAHCIEPNFEIYFSNRGRSSPNGGMLDVDIVTPTHGVPAVENIVYSHKYTMRDGKYIFYVHNYSHMGSKHGFRAELEVEGQIYEFDYSKPTRGGERINVAEVTVAGGNISVKTLLDSTSQTREVWNVQTNQFIPVSAVCLSPNYWDDEVGNKHYMFMLKDCINPENPNGFFNEYLTGELHEHRKVFEALGSKMKVADCPDQLSGLGFSSTQRNEVLIRVKGQIERVFKLKF